LRVISVHSNQKDARNIEQSFTRGHRNVNCLQEAEDGDQQDLSTPKAEAGIREKIAIEPECETKRRMWSWSKRRMENRGCAQISQI
jgi:hypothetical protein